MNSTSDLAANAGGFVISLAAAVVILAGSILPFLSPAWVGFEQDRAGAPAATGFSESQLRTVTDSILGDLVLRLGSFGVTLDGTPVLSDRERSHMLDVRGALAGFAGVALASLAILVVADRRAREPAARTRIRMAVSRGARWLAVGIGVAGVASILAFDAVFELFHRLFFAPGTYTFDPRTDRLVQLFPDRFWSETTLAVGAVGLVAALVVARAASPR